jgi:hypothetical protein
MAKGNDVIISVAFNRKNQTLLGGTMFGRVVMWRLKGNYEVEGASLSEEQWVVSQFEDSSNILETPGRVSPHRIPVGKPELRI